MLWHAEPRGSRPNMYVFSELAISWLTSPSRGSSALSPDRKRLLVHNLNDGLDIYEISLKAAAFKKEIQFQGNGNTRSPVRVSFLHGGDAVVSGTQTGVISVWESDTGEQFQVLGYEGL